MQAAMSEKGPVNEAFNVEGPKHPLLQRLKEVTGENEVERQSLEQLMDELSKKKMAFEELKVRERGARASASIGCVCLALMTSDDGWHDDGWCCAACCCQRVSGIENIDELVTIFRRNEEDTFSLFNYIQVR